MDRAWLTRFGVVLAVALGAVYVLGPSFYYFGFSVEERAEPDFDESYLAAVPDWMPEDKHLNLGLDLQGGIHLVMGVEVEKAVMDRAQRRASELEIFAEDKEVALESVKADSDEPIVEVTVGADAAEKFEGVVLDWYQDMQVVSHSGNTWTLTFTPEYLQRIKTNALDQAVKTIRNRVDKMGVAQPQIAKRGDNQVLVQLPGMTDPDRAKDLLGKTAQLEFRIAQDEKTQFIKDNESVLPEGVILGSEAGAGPSGEKISAWYLTATDRRPLEKARDALKEFFPDGTDLFFQKLEGAPGADATYRTFVLTDAAGITGDYLDDARVAVDQQRGGRPYVAFTFNREGAAIFEKLTEENIKRRLAVVLDDTVSSAPYIQSKIGANGQITMGSLKSNEQLFQEANDLALVLKAGALPAPVRILEERTVGASLGPDLIRRGLIALMIGGLLILLFMPVYYRVGGVVADISLVLNIFVLLSILAGFGATLTLPGIAGIVLTVGMAVDANVIIFERVREELDVGKTARAAIAAGYEKAFSAILDGNLTTGIAAMVLLQYGTGPIRGFAVTLLAGIVSTLFTGYFASRVFMDLFSHGKESVSV